MEYISSKEAALQWGISERLVQRYCFENRINGAKKYGHYWMIPLDAKKPLKLNKNEPNKAEHDCMLPMDDTFIVCLPKWQSPGEAEDVLLALSGETAELFKMELAYYRGQAKLAHSLARKLFETAKNNETRLACLQVVALCSIYRGNIIDWTEANQLMYDLIPWRPEAYVMKELAIASVRISFIDLSTVPEWLKSGDFDKLPDYGSFQAIFIYIKSLQLTFKFELAKHVVKTALTRREFRTNPITRSYLELTLASLIYAMHDDDLAKVHIRTALEYILPDSLYGILIENFGWIDSLLKIVMSEDGLIEQWRCIVRLYEQYKTGWVKIGRHVIGEQWAVELTSREWCALRYAVIGMSTADISSHMSISVESVKKYLGSVYNKLSISGRNEIKSLLPFYGAGESAKNTYI